MKILVVYSIKKIKKNRKLRNSVGQLTLKWKTRIKLPRTILPLERSPENFPGFVRRRRGLASGETTHRSERVRNKEKADKLLPEQSRLYRRSNWLREIEPASYKVTAGFAEIPVPLLRLPLVRINGRLRSPLLSTKSPDRIGRHATKRRKATEGQRLSPQGKEELRVLLKIHSTDFHRAIHL